MPKNSDRNQIADYVAQMIFASQIIADDEWMEQMLGLGDTVDILPFRNEEESAVFEDGMLCLAYLEMSRYFWDHTFIRKATHGPLYYTLNVYKIANPELFRAFLRITPTGFDHLVAALRGHRVFHQRSHSEQVPVDQQIAITLYRLGNSGNAMSLTKVGIWAGYGHGTIDKITQRVLTAVCDRDFLVATLRPPSEEEKEASRELAESKSCPEWRGGWCGVDGTLVVLHERPQHFGSSFYDRKCNYSTNVQVGLFAICFFIRFLITDYFFSGGISARQPPNI